MRTKLAPVLGALALVLALVACTPEEQTVFDRLNQLRREQGLPELAWEEGLYEKVTSWSGVMAHYGKLAHSPLAEKVPEGWNFLGENVAVASSPEQAHDALAASPSHRANMLSTRFTKVAVGVVERGGRYWVTQVFMG
jgi:uncharacterized protein YkwD